MHAITGNTIHIIHIPNVPHNIYSDKNKCSDDLYTICLTAEIIFIALTINYTSHSVHFKQIKLLILA